MYVCMYVRMYVHLLSCVRTKEDALKEAMTHAALCDIPTVYVGELVPGLGHSTSAADTYPILTRESVRPHTLNPFIPEGAV